MKEGKGIWAALLLAAGIAAAGWFVGQGFFKGRAADRFVTVKGVAERDVKADLALWPLRFVSTHDDLAQAQARIRQSHEQCLEFLKRQGIEPGSVEVQRLEVTDLLANPYRSGPIESRYIVSETLMVRTENPETVQKAGQAISQLVEAGVVLSSEGGMESGPTYLFTGLNALKPAMIAEATAQARRAAEQFAQDSGSRIGKIRQANQGVFEILPRDRAPGVSEAGQLTKTVRVVSTVDYYLTD